MTDFIEFTEDERAALRLEAKADFYFFVRYMFLQRNGFSWSQAPHHKLIAAKLLSIFSGTCLRLIINIPPRYSKTAMVQYFIAWALGYYPDAEFMYCSYSADLAQDSTWEIREIVSHPEYQAIFPGTLIRSDSSAKNDWRTTAGGRVYGVGSEGTVTGKGAGKKREGFGGAIFFDDPLKPLEAYSPVVREKVIRMYQSTLQSRLNAGNVGIVTFMQRLHEEDPCGWMLNGGTGEQWEHLCMPAIQPDGTALWPLMHTIEQLHTLQAASPYVFAGQYMQTPTPEGGSFFTEDSFLVDRQPIETPKPVDCVFATIDTAVKTGKSHDGVGVVFWGRSRYIGHPLTILDWNLKQIEGAFLENWLPTVFERLEQLSKATKARLGSAGVWIEDKASGMVLLQQAAYKGLRVHAIDSKLTAMGKSERVINCSGRVHAGQVKFTRPAYERVSAYKGVTKNHLLGQILRFHPSVKDQGEDDLLDAFAYGVAVALAEQTYVGLMA